MDGVMYAEVRLAQFAGSAHAGPRRGPQEQLRPIIWTVAPCTALCGPNGAATTMSRLLASPVKKNEMNPKLCGETGDFTEVAAFMRQCGEAVVESFEITLPLRALDGCGDSNTAVPTRPFWELRSSELRRRVSAR
jgi:hypothetical protein